MPKGNPNPLPPPIESRWKKGESGNLQGRPKDPPELKALKKLTKQELVEIGNLVVKGNINDLRKISESPDSSVIKVMIAAVAARVISRGDMRALNELLDRLVGKVKEEIHHTGDLPVNPPQIKIMLPANGREAKG